MINDKENFEQELRKALLIKMVSFYREMNSILRSPHLSNGVKRLRLLSTMIESEKSMGEELFIFISQNVFCLDRVKKLKLQKEHMSFKSIKLGKSIHVCLN